MANPKGNPQNLKRPVKGGPSPNPKGRGPDNPMLKNLKRLSTAELQEIINVLIKSDVGQLRLIAKDPSASVIKTMVAAVAVKIINKGDMEALNKLLDRIVGKVTVQIAHSGHRDSEVRIVELPMKDKVEGQTIMVIREQIKDFSGKV